VSIIDKQSLFPICSLSLHQLIYCCDSISGVDCHKWL